MLPLVNGEYYHIYNRGVARQPIFERKRDYDRFLLTLSYYRFAHPPQRLSLFLELSETARVEAFKRLEQSTDLLVDILCFVLMPNHFHLLVKQRSDDGISTYIRRSNNSYSRYFTTKYTRPGALFQGVFKAVHIETDEQLIHLSRYIHLNPFNSFVVKEEDFWDYPWSSLSSYLGNAQSFVDPTPVLTHFHFPDVYKQFLMDHADYAKKLEEIKHLTLEKERKP